MSNYIDLDRYFGVRVPSGLHAAALAVARQEDRTISSYVRVLLRDDLTRRGLLPEQDQAGHPAGGQGGQHGHQ